MSQCWLETNDWKQSYLRQAVRGLKEEGPSLSCYLSLCVHSMWQVNQGKFAGFSGDLTVMTVAAGGS
jgi:hypothetical protein